MKRKVIKLGNSTLVTSLPSKWAERFGLKSGDELELEEQGNKLVLFTDKEHKKEIKHIKLEYSREKYLRRVFASLYKKGYEEIKIESANPKILEFLQTQSSGYIGVEVIDQSENKITVADIVNLDEDQFDSVFRRTTHISLQIAKETIDGLKNNDKELLNRVLKNEIIHNKLTDFCKRLLAKKGYRDELRVKYLYSLVQENERIVDEFKYVAEFFLNHKASEKQIAFFEKSANMLKSFYDCYYKFNEDLVYHIVITRQSVEVEGKKMLLKSQGADSVLIHHTINLAIIIYEAAEPYLEMIY